jgi:hypothetical protein
MWILKMKVDSESQFGGKMAIKHKVSFAGYPLSYYKDDKHLYLVACGFLFGDEKRKKEAVRDMKKQPAVINIEVQGDFVIVVSKQPLFTEPAYDPRIIRPTPVMINWREKKHTWEIASFDRKVLERVYAFAKKHLNAKVLKFKKEKVSNISVTTINPKISAKQKEAMELAINNGYYSYPKKIKMEKLAEMMGVSYSTYQEHLKKAEGAIIPSASS